jgi:hypothetical protein
MNVDVENQSSIDDQLKQQDGYLDAIYKGVQQMKQNATTMGASLQNHLYLAEDMQNDADNTTNNVNRANSKLHTVMEKEGGFCSCGPMAVFLGVTTIIFAVLIVLIMVL